MHHFYLLPLQDVFCWIPFKCLAYKKVWNATMLYLYTCMVTEQVIDLDDFLLLTALLNPYSKPWSPIAY